MMSANNDGSESVDDFLARIASVKDGRDGADEARTRRMEEEILKSRKERQMRRAERARSLSPSKTGPAQVASPVLDSSAKGRALNPPVDFNPQSKPLSRSNAVTGRISPTKDHETPSPRLLPSPDRADTSSSTQSINSGLARSGTLSWQQRPTSRDGATTRQRPLSASAPIGSAHPKSPETEASEEPSRKNIAASLAQKDPTWFRQTQDRGLSSAAYRKNQVEDTPTNMPTSRSMQLPGMSQPRAPSKSPTPEKRGLQDAPPTQSDSRVEPDRFKRGNTPDIAALRNSMVLPPTQLRPTSQESFSSRPLSLHSSSNTNSTIGLDRSSSILSSNRTPSPTKGLGGFVESAMMKRSDSVNKRWGVKANTGLKRGDSVAGGRPQSSLHSRGLSRDLHMTRDSTPSSPLASSRPGSSHTQDPLSSPGIPASASRVEQREDVDEHEKRTEQSSEAATVPEQTSRPETPPNDSQLVRSPSKTMDPRRWSPTKSTWLESALQAKPEPPKLQPLKEDQPKWKVDLQRSRSRAGRDVSPEKIKPGSEEASNVVKLPTLRSFENKPATVQNPTQSVPKEQRERPLSSPKPNGLKATDVNTSTASAPVSRKPEDLPFVRDVPVKEIQAGEKEEMKEPILPKVLDKKPPAVKPKPQTPPKTDFRATLRSRSTGPTSTTNAEPEFKSMFGKLKRTTTQNYVAPDELKNNILSGKAALNVTEGPQKTMRVDEFKDSILNKKEEMNASATKPNQQIETKEKTEAPIPEALARRKTLSKASAPNLAKAAAASQLVPSKPEITPKMALKLVESTGPSRQVEQQDKLLVRSSTKAAPLPVSGTSSKLLSYDKSSAPGSSTKAELGVQPPPDNKAALASPNVVKVSPASAEGIPPTKATTTAGPAGMASGNAPYLGSVIPAATTAGGLPVGSKIASRINPNLAVLLSRGSSPRSSASPAASTEDLSKTSNSVATSTPPSGQTLESLTHMTKGRAKGPRRRAPKADTSAANQSVEQATSACSAPLSPLTKDGLSEGRKTSKPAPSVASRIQQRVLDKAPLSSTKSVQPKAELVGGTHISSTSNRDSEKPKVEVPPSDSARTKPAIASKSPELRRVSSSLSVEPKVKSSPKPSPTPNKKPTSSTAPKALAEDPATPTKTLAASKVVTAKNDSLNGASTMPDIVAKSKDVGPATPSPKPSKLQGLGVDLRLSSPASKPVTKPGILTPPPDTTSINVSKGPLQVKAVLEDYIGPIDTGLVKADFDAQQFLGSMNRTAEKVKRKQHTIKEITGDGRKSSMPPQQEHILYEESLYLITHNFTNDAGASTSEVYLWCGDRTSDASMEDAQIFCRRDAREHNVKLEVVKQGKENCRFIEALGGILITRRSKSSSFYMLCGRRHLGHIVFDEVDMDPSNLCPGYVYLISAQFGKFYLWKGKGAGADEVGSAKLIGMDLGLTGEMEEVEQGAESNAFWQALGVKGPAQWSTDWHQRADINGYPTAMYRVDHERPSVLGSLWGLKRATSPAKGQLAKATCDKVEPFSQRDLETSAIHILDTYRSLYVLVNSQCSSKAAEFVTALYLAQDFAMLSPSIQDRPLLPRCYVVIGEPTPDVKACFRRWSAVDGHSLAGNESMCVPLEEVMEALGL